MNSSAVADKAEAGVTALVDTDGDVVERYSYDPYGRVTVRNGVIDSAGNDTSADEWDERTANTFENNILYAGYLYDDETGLLHVRNRTYHPTLGRWLQRDPAGYVDGMSLYEYLGGCPIAGTDPYGEQENVYDEERIGEVQIVIEAKRAIRNPREIRGAENIVAGARFIGTVATYVQAPAAAAGKAAALGESTVMHLSGALAEEMSGSQISPTGLIDRSLDQIDYIHEVRCTYLHKVWLRAKVRQVQRASLASRVNAWIWGHGGLLKGELVTVHTGAWVLVEVDTDSGPHRGERPISGDNWYWGDEAPSDAEIERATKRAVQEVVDEWNGL